MHLKPSEIFYSQDSINNVFDKRCNHSNKFIGETLDDLCDGRCSVSDIPTIIVIQKDGKWVTADNRRLWVFRQLERLGKCEKINVRKGYYIPDEKQTSYNGGVSVRVRGSPRGYWHLKSPTKAKKPNLPNQTPVNFNHFNTAAHSGINSNSSNVHRSLYGQSTAGVRKTSPIGTAYPYDISSSRVSVTVQNSPRVDNQLDRPTNLNRVENRSYDRVTGRGFDDHITRPGQISCRDTVKPSQPPSSAGSNSDTESNSRNKSLVGSANNRRHERHASSYQAESRNYRHKTYATSYNDGRQNRANSSTTSRDNGCCIII